MQKYWQNAKLLSQNSTFWCVDTLTAMQAGCMSCRKSAQMGREAMGECAQRFDRDWMQIGS